MKALKMRTWFVVAAFALSPAMKGETKELTYTTSYFGNSFVSRNNEAWWVETGMRDIFTLSDGTTYTAGRWDEGGHEVSVYDAAGNKTGYMRNTHDSTNGKGVCANSTYVFATGKNGKFRRFTRSNSEFSGEAQLSGSSDATGIAASESEVFVSDATNGRIRVYATGDLSFKREWSLTRPGKLALDSSGNLWAIQEGDASNAHRVHRYNSTGTLLTTVTFASSVIPTDIAVQNSSWLLVTDRGPDHNVKVYNISSLSGSPTNVSSTIGVTGGVFAETTTMGIFGSGRLNQPAGVGIDSSGNIYVSNMLSNTTMDARLVKFNASGTQQWERYTTDFEDCAAIDPNYETSLYSKDNRYRANWSGGVGSEVVPFATTLHPQRYPHDPRLFVNKNGNNVAGAIIRRINGKKFLFVEDQQSAYLQVFRFNGSTDGEIAIPCALFARSGRTSPGSDWPYNQPATSDSWIWTDTNGNGRMDSGEYQTYAGDNPYMYGWYVDRDGSVWKGLRENGVRKIPCTGVNSTYGYPIYNLSTSSKESNPGPFNNSGDIRRVLYRADSGWMFISGFVTGGNRPPSGHEDSRGGGSKLAGYANWSGGNRTPTWQIDLPWVWQDYTVASIDTAGEYIFVSYFSWSAPAGSHQGGLIKVFRTVDGVYMGDISNGTKLFNTVGSWGDSDCQNTVRAFKRANGEYIITHSDYWHNRQMLFRWTPPSA